MTRFFIAVLVVLSLSQCPVAAASTPAQFRSQANAICTRAQARLLRVKRPTSPRDFATYFKAALAIARTKYAALGKLSTPHALHSLHDTALANLTKELDVMQAGISKMVAGSD